MNSSEAIPLTRDVEAAVVPVGSVVTLQKGEQAYITQSLGGAYTVIVNGNMFRIYGKDADALGIQQQAKAASTGAPVTQEHLEKEIWNQLRSCYDPEIPVNIVDLGLVYDCQVVSVPATGTKVEVKMTLTAPGCGMGPSIAQDARSKILTIPGVDEADVELVWDPPWNQHMISEAGKMKLGLI